MRLIADPHILSSHPTGGEPLAPHALSHAFTRVNRRVGLDCHRHELRHFTATTAIAGGADIRTVPGRLGHARPVGDTPDLCTRRRGPRPPSGRHPGEGGAASTDHVLASSSSARRAVRAAKSTARSCRPIVVTPHRAPPASSHARSSPRSRRSLTTGTISLRPMRMAGSSARLAASEAPCRERPSNPAATGTDTTVRARQSQGTIVLARPASA